MPPVCQGPSGAGCTPQSLAQPGCPRHRPPDRGPDGVLGPDEDQLPARPGDRGVQKLAGQDARARVGQQHGRSVELRALALVDRHRVHGLDRAEPQRAEVQKPLPRSNTAVGFAPAPWMITPVSPL